MALISSFNSVTKWYTKYMDFFNIYLVSAIESLYGVHRFIHMYPRLLRIIPHIDLIIRLGLFVGISIYERVVLNIIVIIPLSIIDLITHIMRSKNTKKYVELVKSLKNLRDDITATYEIKLFDTFFGAALPLLIHIFFARRFLQSLQNPDVNWLERLTYTNFIRIIMEMLNFMQIMFVFKSLINAHQRMLTNLCSKIQQPFYDDKKMYKEFGQIYRSYKRLEDCSLLSCRIFTNIVSIFLALCKIIS